MPIDVGGGATSNIDNIVDQIFAAIAQRESGGNYSAVNPDSGAYGIVQIMPSNWPAWAAEAGRKGASPTPADQEFVAKFKMRQYLEQFGSPEAVAVAWYAGPAAAQAWLKNPNTTRFTRKQGGGKYPSINQYVDNFKRTFESAGATAGGIGGAIGSAVSGVAGAVAGVAAGVPAGAQAAGQPVRPQTGAVSGSNVLAPPPIPSSGGGGGGGVSVAAAAATPPAGIAPPGLSTPQLDDWIAKNFASDAWMLNHPELGPIVRAHARGDLNDAQYSSALQNSHYFRSKNDAARQFEQLRNTNPQEAERTLADRATALKRTGAQLGVPLSDEQARTIAERSLTLGWSDSDLNESLVGMVNFDQPLQGNAASFSQQIESIARSYGVPVADVTVNGWVRGLLDGTVTMDTVSAYFRDHAKSLYPWMTGQIDAGITPLQYASPYMETVAKMLEVNPATVDLDNPFVKQALRRVDPESGQASPMGLWDFEQFLRRTPEYDRTKGALGEAAGFAEMLGRAFGKVA